MLAWHSLPVSILMYRKVCHSLFLSVSGFIKAHFLLPYSTNEKKKRSVLNTVDNIIHPVKMKT